MQSREHIRNVARTTRERDNEDKNVFEILSGYLFCLVLIANPDAPNHNLINSNSKSSQSPEVKLEYQPSQNQSFTSHYRHCYLGYSNAKRKMGSCSPLIHIYQYF